MSKHPENPINPILMQKKGISYARVSTSNQMLDANGMQKEDSSPAAQKKRCENHTQYMSSKTGMNYVIIEHFSDEGFSAKNVNRPGYQKMWNMIESKSINFIIASELSRLSRSVVDFLALVSHCKDHDVDIIIIGLDLDTSNPFGRVIVVILVALAQFEREMTSMRVKENALSRLLSDGKINGSAEILGLDRDPKHPGHYVANKEELKNVELLMNYFLQVQGKIKVIEKAKELGILTKKGSQFELKHLDVMLNHARWRYRGLWYANKENKDKDPTFIPENKRYQIVPLRHGPLIDEALLDKVVARFDEVNLNKKLYRTGRENYTYLLSGLLFNGDGTTFTGEYGKKRKYRYYLNKTTHQRFPCQDIDSTLRSSIKDFFTDGANSYEQHIKEVHRKLQEFIPSIQAEIEDVKKSLDKLKTRDLDLHHIFKNSGLNDPVYLKWLKGQITEIQNERDQLNEKMEELDARMLFLVEKCEGSGEVGVGLSEYLADGFDLLPGTMRRVIIEKFIKRITINEVYEMRIELKVPQRFCSWIEGENLGQNEVGSSTMGLNGVELKAQCKINFLSYYPVRFIDLSIWFKASSISFLTENYVDKQLSIAQIANLTSSSVNRIRDALIRFNIPIREKNKHHGRKSQLGFGEKRIKGKIVDSQKELTAIQVMEELQAQGLSLRKIASILNMMKIPTKNLKGIWSHKVVDQILKRKVNSV